MVILLTSLSNIALALLLVAWKRSQRTIALFTGAVMLIALVANVSLLTIQPTTVTQLLKVDSYSAFAFSLVLLSALVSLHMSHQFLKAHIEVHDEYYLLLMLLVKMTLLHVQGVKSLLQYCQI